MKKDVFFRFLQIDKNRHGSFYCNSDEMIFATSHSMIKIEINK